MLAYRLLKGQTQPEFQEVPKMNLAQLVSEIQSKTNV